MKFILDAKVVFCGNLQNISRDFFKKETKYGNHLLQGDFSLSLFSNQISCIHQELYRILCMKIKNE